MPAPHAARPRPADGSPGSRLEASAVAQPNIALVKYWGKRDSALNLPDTGSLSITLATLKTRTRVSFDPALHDDILVLGGVAHRAHQARTSAVLDLLRTEADCDMRARVESANTFPTGAGLASSASGFAALTVAAAAALGLDLPRARLSEIARRGSGSAARSLVGGFAEMHRGTRPDGSDAVAEQVLDAADWPLEVVVAITSRHRKQTSSGEGMERSRRTSPFYDSWLRDAEGDLASARTAIRDRDFDALAAVSEHSCTKMHAVMQTSRPALIYWTGATVDCLHRIRHLRETDGVATFFTVDAGPQVKAVCLPGQAGRVAAALAEIPGVLDVLTTGLGDGAQVVEGAQVDLP